MEKTRSGRTRVPSQRVMEAQAASSSSSTVVGRGRTPSKARPAPPSSSTPVASETKRARSVSKGRSSSANTATTASSSTGDETVSATPTQPRKRRSSKATDLQKISTAIDEINTSVNATSVDEVKEEENAPFAFFMAPCLCVVDDIPEWQFQHRNLRFGYRKCSTFTEALLSLFSWHNETMNMWIHYIGSALVAYKTYQTSLKIFHHTAASNVYECAFITLCMILGNVFPLFASAFAHHFYCISKTWHKICWYVDFIGILSGITWVALSFVYLAFYCNPKVHHVLTVVLSLGYVTSMYYCWARYHPRMSQASLLPKDRFPEFSSTLSSFSVISFLTTVPTTFYFHGDEYFVDPRLWNIVASSSMYSLCMALGIVVFAQGHVPERFIDTWGLPKNYFDFIGHSHQWWHCASFALLYMWGDLMYSHYDTRMELGCSNNHWQNM